MLNNSRLFLMVAFLISVSYSPSYAELWIEYSSSKSQETGGATMVVESFYDSEGLKYSSDSRFRVWLKSKIITTSGSGRSHESLTLVEFDCINKTYEVMVGGFDDPQLAKLNKGVIFPESTDNILTKLFCKTILLPEHF